MRGNPRAANLLGSWGSSVIRSSARKNVQARPEIRFQPLFRRTTNSIQETAAFECGGRQ